MNNNPTKETRNGSAQLVRRDEKKGIEDVKNDKIIFILCAKRIVRFILLFSFRPIFTSFAPSLSQSTQ